MVRTCSVVDCLRRAQRHGLCRSCFATSGGSVCAVSGCEATVLNLSDTGFMAMSDGHDEVGSRIWLMVPGKDRRNAVVKWVAGRRFGAEFAEPKAPSF